jgi:hypothetical protein
MTAYNALSKVKFAGVQLDYNLAEIETRRVEQSPTSYDEYNKEEHYYQPLDLAGGKLKIGERIMINHQPYLRGTITIPGVGGNPATSRTVTLSAKNEDQKSFFGNLGNSEKVLTDIYVSGGDVNPKDLKIRNGINDKGQPVDKNGKVIQMYSVDNLGNQVKDDWKVFGTDYLTKGAGGTVSYSLMKSDNNLGAQKYVLHLPNKNGKEQSISLDDYSQFVAISNDIYYIYGEGRHEINAAKSKDILNRLQAITVEEEE